MFWKISFLRVCCLFSWLNLDPKQGYTFAIVYCCFNISKFPFLFPRNTVISPARITPMMKVIGIQDNKTLEKSASQTLLSWALCVRSKRITPSPWTSPLGTCLSERTACRHLWNSLPGCARNYFPLFLTRFLPRTETSAANSCNLSCVDVDFHVA